MTSLVQICPRVGSSGPAGFSEPGLILGRNDNTRSTMLLSSVRPRRDSTPSHRSSLREPQRSPTAPQPRSQRQLPPQVRLSGTMGAGVGCVPIHAVTEGLESSAPPLVAPRTYSQCRWDSLESVKALAGGFQRDCSQPVLLTAPGDPAWLTAGDEPQCWPVLRGLEILGEES